MQSEISYVGNQSKSSPCAKIASYEYDSEHCSVGFLADYASKQNNQWETCRQHHSDHHDHPANDKYRTK
jgi:hypothetical protein